MQRIPVTVGDLTFDVVDAGPRDGTPVLLLHGFPQSADSWRDVVPALVAAGYRCLAPDQRGYCPGARPLGTEQYRMPLLVADALGLLDALGLPRAHVVGHDWGAAVAWQLAARHADRVRTLTAVSVPHPKAFRAALMSDPDQRAKSQYMRDWRAVGTAEQTLLADDAAALRAVFGPMGARGQEYIRRMQQPGALTAGLEWYRAAAAADTETMPPVTVPVLYVWSDEDLALGAVAAHATGAEVDGPYRFEVLHGVSHWVPEQAAPQLVAMLLEHLGG